jgi:alpha-tubulin suppressor-like RCC1 family protein
VTGLSAGVTAVAATHTHGLALRDGAVYAWGSNLGVGRPYDEANRWTPAPVPVAGLSDGVTAIAGGAHFSLAVRDGLVYGWGSNWMGELGDGTKENTRLTPAPVPGLTGIVDVAAGAWSSYALSGDGRLWSWGYNSWGQLGVGDRFERLAPTEVLPPAGYAFTSVDAGDYHGLATVTPVPEPAGLALLGIGLIALRRRAVRHRPASAERGAAGCRGGSSDLFT